MLYQNLWLSEYINFSKFDSALDCLSDLTSHNFPPPSFVLFQAHWPASCSSSMPGALCLRAFALAVRSALNTFLRYPHLAYILTSFGFLLICQLLTILYKIRLLGNAESPSLMRYQGQTQGFLRPQHLNRSMSIPPAPSVSFKLTEDNFSWDDTVIYAWFSINVF